MQSLWRANVDHRIYPPEVAFWLGSNCQTHPCTDRGDLLDYVACNKLNIIELG
jgi:hypothetical protein